MAFNIFATATSDIPLANLDANFTMIGSSAVASTLYPTATTSITYGTAGTIHYFSGSGLSVTGTLSATGAIQTGSGNSTSAGLIAGYFGASSYGAIWSTAVTPSTTNFSFLTNATSTVLNGTTGVTFQIGNVDKVAVSSTGLAVTGALTVTRSGNTAALITQTGATGYGLIIVPGADTVYDAFGINNAANTLNQIRMYGNGTATFAGGVGIGGAASPGSTGLAVTGTLSAGGTFTQQGSGINTGGYLTINSATNTNTVIKYGANTGSAPDLVFKNDPAISVMTLDASGNLLVGGTSLVSSGKISITFSQSSNQGVALKNSSAGNAANYILFVNSADAQSGIIAQTGATSVVYTTTSDYRLKKNQEPLTNSGNFIDALKPKTWEWVADGSKASGFIAHEFSEISPLSVFGEKDATREEEYEISPAIPATQDEEGNEITAAVEAVKGNRTVPVYQGMQASSSEVIANMVAELQSLRKRITALEAK